MTAFVRQGVRLGIITPVATQMPGAHAAWEADAGIDEMVQIAAGGRPARASTT